MSESLPKKVRIVEVGPRDGLQNEAQAIDTDQKVAFIQKLVDAGHCDIEVTSFVHPKAVPQLADAADVIAQLPNFDQGRYSALVPNDRGLDRAIESGIKRIAVFTAASETFCQKNIGMSRNESLALFDKICTRAMGAGLSIRGYVSTCFVCPYEGEIGEAVVSETTRALLDMGVDEVSVSDTIGAASPRDVERVLLHVFETSPREAIALHFHDTFGTALANVCEGLRLGVTTFDASSGGLGGCPFAPGATGNLATEDLVYLLDRMGIESGIDLNRQAEASRYISGVLGRKLPSRQLQRLDAACGN
ncbi:MAG: hydroxymethylglutaryl-CoA lyase [Phycisphaerae bacterium]|nr:MAG: hydroxymethylglutaryl-CoA lyase [Phycisphaerae bacterium]